MQLVSVINGPICSAQLDQCIKERGKKKPLVSITPCDDSNQIEITYHGNNLKVSIANYYYNKLYS